MLADYVYSNDTVLSDG